MKQISVKYGIGDRAKINDKTSVKSLVGMECTIEDETPMEELHATMFPEASIVDVFRAYREGGWYTIKIDNIEDLKVAHETTLDPLVDWWGELGLEDKKDIQDEVEKPAKV